MRSADGRVLTVADLVDDGPAREKVVAALRKAKGRDKLDISIALGMAPRFRFHTRPVAKDGKPVDDGADHVRVDESTGEVHVRIKGLREPSTDAVRRIIDEDLNDLLAAVAQDPRIVSRALADVATVPEVVNQVLIPS